MTEKQFADFFDHGIVQAVNLRFLPGVGTVIYFLLVGGDVHCVTTRRGAPKGYRTDTSILFLKSCGLKDVKLDCSSWLSAIQAELSFA